MLTITPLNAPAQDRSLAEETVYNAALRAFKDGFYERADSELAEFVKEFPNSKSKPEAILIRAQAIFKLGRYNEAINLIEQNTANAAGFIDNYHYWMGEIHFQAGDYNAALKDYEKLISDFPDSLLIPQAALGRAMTYYKTGRSQTTIDLLLDPEGAFQKAAQAQPNNEYVIRGYLLLAESLLEQNQLAKAKDTLSLLVNRNLPPELDWRRQYLLVRTCLADNQLDAAVNNASNLVQIVKDKGLTNRSADTYNILGQALTESDQLQDALDAHKNNLAEGVPTEAQRQALLHIIDLTIRLNDIPSAIQWLNRFSEQNASSKISDLVTLTLAELKLKQYHGIKPDSPENRQTRDTLLQECTQNADTLINTFTNSPFLGKAFLTKGWALWESSRFTECIPVFTAAAQRLNNIEDKATAYIKCADAQFKTGDFTSALDNYINASSNTDSLPTALAEQALLGTVLAAEKTGRTDPAQNALDQIMSKFNETDTAEKALFFVGRLLSRHGNTDGARDKFNTLLDKYPDSSLIQETEFAIAESYRRDRNWDKAIEIYDNWINRFTNSPALPKTEFKRAWTYYQAGHETNALDLFTNFVQQFQTNELAPQAQYWIGDFYFRHDDYVNSEKTYQILFQNWPGSKIAYEARLAAGRSAFNRRVLRDATNYFTTLIDILIDDTNSPPDLLAETYFAFGDALIELPSAESTNQLNRFSQAINALTKIPDSSSLAPAAWGRIAQCHFQLAAQNPSHYKTAEEYYNKILQYPDPNPEILCLAEIGLGALYKTQANNAAGKERTALLDTALQHYQNVVYAKNMESIPPYWLARACEEAIDLLKTQKKFDQLITLCNRMIKQLPALSQRYKAIIDESNAAIP